MREKPEGVFAFVLRERFSSLLYSFGVNRLANFFGGGVSLRTSRPQEHGQGAKKPGDPWVAF